MITKIKNHFDFILLGLISAWFLTLQISLSHFNMNDFKVYYTAGNRLLNHQPLFRIIADGHYVFKYSPTFAFFSIPLSILQLFWAKIIYWFLLTLIVGSSIRLASKVLGSRINPARSHVVIAVGTIVVMTMHFLREIDLGQVNLLLVCTYLWAGERFFKGKFLFSAVLLAFSLFVKPFSLIFIPYFLIKREFKLIGYFILFACIGFLLPCLIVGFDAGIDLQSQWVQEILIEISNKKDLLQGGNHTVFSVIARYTPFFYFLKTPLSQSIFKIGLVILIACSYLVFIFKSTQNEWIDWIVLISWIPLLSYTSDNAFGSYLMFLIIYILSKINKKTVWMIFPLFFLFLNPLELNRDVAWTHVVFDTSLMGLSALIGMGFVYYYRMTQKV